MRRSLCAVALAVVCLASSQHDLANAGGKWFKHKSAGCAAPYGCAMPYGCAAPTCGMPFGCSAPGCYAPMCSGPMCSGPTCGVPACHGPFAPLVAHYYGGCAAPGCFGPGCSGCGAPMCSMPGCGMPMGAYGGPMYAPQSAMMYHGFQGAPLMSGMPVPDYYAPMGPMSAPIPAVPAAEDVVW